MKKIYVLGSNGMLGNYVTEFFKNTKEYDVIPITKKELNVDLFSEKQLQDIILTLNPKENDVFINCIGLVKQRKNLTDLDFYIVNSLFPQILSKVCNNLKIKLIHITTDCVFDGLKGGYSEDDIHDSTDSYGLSKSIGEKINSTVIRTSIIGEEKTNKLSLIEWVKSNKNSTINGYTNHIWNGVTCLQFAKICYDIIKNNKYWIGIKHIYSNSVTKYELVKMISEIYELNIQVNGLDTNIKCDRSLKTKYNNMFNIPKIEYQIKEQRYFLNDFN